MDKEYIKDIIYLSILLAFSLFTGYLVFNLIKYIVKYRRRGSKWSQILFGYGSGDDCKKDNQCSSNICQGNLCIV